jgi:hypothetical protein
MGVELQALCGKCVHHCKMNGLIETSVILILLIVWCCVAISESAYFMFNPNCSAPTKLVYLDVPAGVSLGLNADKVQRNGVKAKEPM